MKSKTYSLFALSILAVLVLASCVSAAITFGTAPTLSKEVGNHIGASITIATATETITTCLVGDIAYEGKNIDFTGETISGSGTSYTCTFNYSVEEGFEFTEDLIATLTTDASTTEIASLDFEYNPLEGYADNGDLDISIDDLSIEEGFGPEDNEWYLLDEIKAEIEVSANVDMENIVVEWGLYDKTAGNWIVDGEEDNFDLDEDDEEKLTITFQLDEDAINEIDADSDDYVFYAWATGEDKEDNDNKTSAYESNEIDLKIDDNFVVLDKIEISGTASCGSEVQITADVWNIGSEDQDEVYVIIYNKELGINKKVEVGDINALDSEKLDATITLPDNAEEKQYDLTLTIYDEDNDIFENDEDDIAEFSVPLTVESGSCSTLPSATITASLQSDAKAGAELIVKAVIINTGSETKTFGLSASGYTDWASLGSIDKTSVTLDAGESQDVLITLNVNKDISGEKKFNIELVEGNKLVSQSVSVSIEEASSTPPSLTGLFSGIGGDNWYLWGIGALNVLLVLIIIIVAVRVSRKKE